MRQSRCYGSIQVVAAIRLITALTGHRPGCMEAHGSWKLSQAVVLALTRACSLGSSRPTAGMPRLGHSL